MVKKNILQKGFTLIELLVVVAIIGILSAIVLVSLNSARAKARDASAKGSISSIRAAAEIFYDTNGVSYNNGDPGGDMCGDSDVVSLMDAAENQTSNTPQCLANDLAYAVSVELNSTNIFCVDSTGFAGDFRSDGTKITGSSTVCQP